MWYEYACFPIPIRLLIYKSNRIEKKAKRVQPQAVEFQKPKANYAEEDVEFGSDRSLCCFKTCH